MQEAAPLTRIPGIGKKTAERLLLELKGKLAETSTTPGGGQHASDVVNALVALGYSDKEALAAVKGLAPGMPVAEGDPRRPEGARQVLTLRYSRNSA